MKCPECEEQVETITVHETYTQVITSELSLDAEKNVSEEFVDKDASEEYTFYCQCGHKLTDDRAEAEIYLEFEEVED